MRLNLRSTPINFSGSGDNIIVTTPTIGPIRVFGIFFTVGGATNITFKNAATALSGPLNFTSNGSSMSLVIGEEPYFNCDPGNNFVMNSSNAVQVSGTAYYSFG